MIIAVVAKISPDHPKAPDIEQKLSAGAAAQQILLAANALGFGSVWVTGAYAFDDFVKKSLGIDTANPIIGFIYLGTPTIGKPQVSRPNPDNFTRHWQG